MKIANTAVIVFVIFIGASLIGCPTEPNLEDVFHGLIYLETSYEVIELEEDIFEYTQSVPASVEEIQVRAELGSTLDLLEVNGSKIPSGSLSFPIMLTEGGDTAIEIIVTSLPEEDVPEETVTYLLIVTRGSYEVTVDPPVWSLPFQLSNEIGPGASAGAPRIAANESGDAVAVWREEDGSYNDLFASTRIGENEWTEPVRINTNGTGVESNFDLDINENGDAIVVWRETESGNLNLYAKRYDGASGQWASGSSSVEMTSYSVGSINTAIDDNSNAIVVWTQSDGTNTNAYRNYRTGGDPGAWGGAEILDFTAETASNVDVDMNADGDTMVAWQQSDGTSERIHTRYYNSDNSTWNIEPLIADSNSGSSNEIPHAGVFGDGTAVVGWVVNSSYNEVQIASFDGTAFTDQETISNTSETGNVMNNPQNWYLSVSDSGYAAAAWNLDTVETDYFVIRGAYYDRTSWSADEVLSTDTYGHISCVPSIDVNESGIAVIAFTSINPMGYYLPAVSVRNGSSWAYHGAISSISASAYFAEAAINGNREIILAWLQNNNNNSKVLCSEYY